MARWIAEAKKREGNFWALKKLALPFKLIDYFYFNLYIFSLYLPLFCPLVIF